jgi:DNA helicase HerA-like ATPase
MFTDGKIWAAMKEDGTRISLLPNKANRHGLVAGATGTGKTVTLKVMAESFSAMGVPVFMADVKGDIASLMAPGTESEDMKARIERFGLAGSGFAFRGYPVSLWDIYGKTGIPLRTTITEMGPLLLSRILDLNDLQSDILSIVFKIADDEGLLLVDTKDLKSMLHYVDENAKDYAESYGRISTASIGAITRALVALELEGGDVFFGEPALNVSDWFSTSTDGRGMIHILDSSSLIRNGRLYSTFLLWLLSELFELLPEVGDLDKPRLVFFFDEAHLLFHDAPKVLLDKIEQVVKLIRSKGVGVYFCTQNPRDIPDGVLAQLGNKVQHGLRAYTPSDQKAVKAAAESFRENPEFDTFDTILNLGTGEAVVSFLDESGIPGVAEKAYILPPESRFGPVSDAERQSSVNASLLFVKYSKAVDPDSAYEFLSRKGVEAAENARKQAEAEQKEKEELAAKKEADKIKAKEEALKEREEKKEAAVKKRAAKTVASSVVGTVGREAGKQFGKKFGSFGKTIGGNLGASLGRGILSTLFKI